MGFVPNAAGKLFNGAANSMTQKNGFEATMAPMNQFDVNPNVIEQYQNLTATQKQQQDLAAVLQAQMNGNGPNPAQQQFQENAGQVGAQAAGLVASQKGINPALAARLAAQQQASAQQNAAGAAATMQAQQQLAAQQQLGQQQGQMAGQALNAENMFLNTNNAQNAQLGTNFNAAQGINSGIAQSNTNSVNQMSMGMMQGAASAGAKAASGGASGGGGMAHGGMVTLANALMQGGMVPGNAMVHGDSPKNDTVHAMLSPGEIVIPRSMAEDPERAKRFIEELNAGGVVGYGKVLAAKRKAKNG